MIPGSLEARRAAIAKAIGFHSNKLRKLERALKLINEKIERSKGNNQNGRII